MKTLDTIGMNRNWIYEVIVTTYRNDTPHAAPIGVWTEDSRSMQMQIYKGGKTIDNVMRLKEFAVNLISDITLFYASLFTKAEIAYQQAPHVYAPVMQDASAFIELRVADVEEKENSFCFTATPIHIQIKDTMHLINRAAGLSLESLILATKLPHFPRRGIEETLKENYRIIKKVAPGSQYQKMTEMLLGRLEIDWESIRRTK